MAQAEWTRLASEDLEAIYLYIAYESRRPIVAQKVFRTIADLCDKYATLFAAGNVLGSDCSDIAPGLRCFTHQRWVILFRPLPASIRILAVVDGGRDYCGLFLDRSNTEE